MLCTDCAVSFFQDPFKMGIVIVSLMLSMLSLLLIRTQRSINRKAVLVYLHIFGLLFPLFFYIFFNGCSSFFSSCSTAKATLYLIMVTGISAALIGGILASILFLKMHKRNSKEVTSGFAVELLARKSRELTINRPRLYALKTAKPVAFSNSLFSPAIFISAGMADILTRKELGAVLMHELGHIKNSSSELKLSSSLMSLLSPASHIASFRDELSKDEASADDFAVSVQGSGKHLASAKARILEYGAEDG